MVRSGVGKRGRFLVLMWIHINFGVVNHCNEEDWTYLGVVIHTLRYSSLARTLPLLGIRKRCSQFQGPKGAYEAETNPVFVEMQCSNHRLRLRSASCPNSTNPHHKHSKVCRTNFQTDQKLPGSCRNLFLLSNNPKMLQYSKDQIFRGINIQRN